MEHNIFNYTLDYSNYLNEDEKKKISERVFEEEARNYFHEYMSRVDNLIFHDKPTVYHRVLDKYIRECGLFHDEFIPYIKEVIKKEIDCILNPTDENNQYNDLSNIINFQIQHIAVDVINDNKDKLEPIVLDKVIRCCNETLLIAFLSDIVRGMNLDKAVKSIIQEMEGNKK